MKKELGMETLKTSLCANIYLLDTILYLRTLKNLITANTAFNGESRVLTSNAA